MSDTYLAFQKLGVIRVTR